MRPLIFTKFWKPLYSYAALVLRFSELCENCGVSSHQILTVRTDRPETALKIMNPQSRTYFDIGHGWSEIAFRWSCGSCNNISTCIPPLYWGVWQFIILSVASGLSVLPVKSWCDQTLQFSQSSENLCTMTFTGIDIVGWTTMFTLNSISKLSVLVSKVDVTRPSNIHKVLKNSVYKDKKK